MDTLDAYITDAPSSQNVLNLFKGEWSSKLPQELGLSTQPGTAGLFEDARITWTEEVFGSFRNWKILELGPLEGGHSYMFQNRGASKIISIEANTRAFLKCLCIKEILNLKKVEFKLGDFMPYLRTDTAKYDMVFASGVLYHMEEPTELLKMIAKVSDRTFIWTQYFDPEIIAGREDLRDKFGPLVTFDYEGVAYQGSIQAYKEALNWSGFCGGPKPVSKWLTKQSIIDALTHYGFTDIKINFDAPQHQNGPAMAICAKKA
jgi:Protein of unknown function (DUF1698)